MTSLGEVGLTLGPEHVKTALLTAASRHFSQDFSDVTLVFQDVGLDYYKALLYLLSPWWKELLLQVRNFSCSWLLVFFVFVICLLLPKLLNFILEGSFLHQSAPSPHIKGTVFLLFTRFLLDNRSLWKQVPFLFPL